MRIQNVASAYRANFMANENNKRKLYEAFMYILNNSDKLEASDVFVSNRGNETENSSSPEKDDENTENTPAVTITKDAQPEEDENLTKDIQSTEDENLTEDKPAELNYKTEDESVLLCKLKKIPEPAPEIPAEELALLREDANYVPRHAKTDKIPKEEAIDMSKLRPVIGIRKNEKTEAILKERLEKYRGKNNPLMISDVMYDALCKLKPETIEAIQSDELLYLMAAEGKDLCRLFQKNTLIKKDRIQMLHNFEAAFTEDEIEKLTSSDENNSATIVSLAKWLLTYENVQHRNMVLYKLKNTPKTEPSGEEFSIISYFEPYKLGRLKMFLQGFNRNRNKY